MAFDRAISRQLHEEHAATLARLVSHVQKEKMALLPALEDLLDEQADRELQLAYAS